ALSKEPDQRFGTMEEFATAVWPEQPVAVPKAGSAAKSQRRPPPRQAHPATADAPTEMTNAPTTPIPRAGMKIPSEKKKRSSVGMVVGTLVVVAAGVGGYLALGRKSEPPPPPPPPPPSRQASLPPAAPVAVPVETIRVATQRRQASPP